MVIVIFEAESTGIGGLTMRVRTGRFEWLRSGESRKPLATLWRPELSGVMHSEFGVRGLEAIQSAGKRRWVAQRWLCEPMNYAQALEEQKRVQAETWRWS